MIMKRRWMISLFSKTLTLKPSIRRSFCSSSSSTATFALKNVTKTNFDSALVDLRRHVRDADFVAIDLEMTGIASAPWRESFEFDRFDILYLKVKDSVEKFAVVQFGVCPFLWEPSKNSFVAHPEQEEAARRRLNSLCENGFVESQSNLKENKHVPMADVLFTERLKSKLSEWRDSLSQVRNGEHACKRSSDGSLQQFETIFFKMRPALKLNGFTSHQLRLIKLVAENHFKDLVYISASGECSSLLQLLVFTESRTDKDLLKKEVKACLHKEAERKIYNAVGFHHVIDLLSSEQKLIVGHNCFLGYSDKKKWEVSSHPLCTMHNPKQMGREGGLQLGERIGRGQCNFCLLLLQLLVLLITLLLFSCEC